MKVKPRVRLTLLSFYSELSITSASLAEADRELEVNGSTDTVYSGQSPGFEQEDKGGGRTPFPALFPN